MPGRQLDFAIRGDQYEKAFASIASNFLSVVPVPRPSDYGIDAYCHVLHSVDSISSTVGGAFGVQVRGRGRKLEFGGFAEGGKAWKEYEIEWLRTLAVPLYLARVSDDYLRADFYSLWPIWLILGGSRKPFRIVCEFDDPSVAKFTLQGASTNKDGMYGDGITSTVSLGPPFISVTQQQLNETAFHENVKNLFELWLKYDRTTVTHLLLGVANVKGTREWFTNDFESSSRILKTWMAWNAAPGANLDVICDAFEPVATILGWHLQRQDDQAAYGLIPALEWLKSRGSLGGFGTDLLTTLRECQVRGVSPRPRS